MPQRAPAMTPYATPRCIDCSKKNGNGAQNSGSAAKASCLILHSGPSKRNAIELKAKGEAKSWVAIGEKKAAEIR
ncbi:hypothetical protein [Paraburkholderia sp.]|uniref:hypothetical protein n=1 Tax=Paraburkholderia sp. TaxID=1926495 RepID=UPI002ED45176